MTVTARRSSSAFVVDRAGKREPRTHRFLVQIEPTLVDAVDSLCDELDVTRAAYFRELAIRDLVMRGRARIDGDVTLEAVP